MSRFNSGDWVVFTYLKGASSSIEEGYLLSDYSDNEESYRGEVVKVRDIVSEPLSKQTWRSTSIKGPRSRRLVTVRLPDGSLKSFYEGRVVSATRLDDSFIQTLSVLGLTQGELN